MESLILNRLLTYFFSLGCRFIEEKASNSSRRFLPLINLDKNGTLHLKVALTGVHRCNKYQIYVKRPKQHTWVAMAMGDNFFNTFWIESTEISLTLQVKGQSFKFTFIAFVTLRPRFHVSCKILTE